MSNNSNLKDFILLKSQRIAERRAVDDFYTVNSAADKINLINNLSNEEYNFLVQFC